MAVSVPTGTPPRWVNALLALMLRTPGLQRWMGRSVALFAFKGRKTGRLYTTPVTYFRDRGAVIVLSRTDRSWWRNLREAAEVELRLAGRTFRGLARATLGDESDLPALAAFLENRRADARAFGVRFTPDGSANPQDLRDLLTRLVVIRITLS